MNNDLARFFAELYDLPAAFPVTLEGLEALGLIERVNYAKVSDPDFDETVYRVLRSGVYYIGEWYDEGDEIPDA